MAPTIFRLTLSAERAEALAALGVAYVYELPFDLDFSHLTAEQFVGDVLHAGLGAAHLACGADFAFGYRRGGSTDYMAAQATAFKIAASPEFKDRQERTIRGAKILADRLMAEDTRSAGVDVLTGGTDVHLVLVDLRESAIHGASIVRCSAMSPGVASAGIPATYLSMAERVKPCPWSSCTSSRTPSVQRARSPSTVSEAPPSALGAVMPAHASLR